jgi:hypothetical protein
MADLGYARWYMSTVDIADYVQMHRLDQTEVPAKPAARNRRDKCRSNRSSGINPLVTELPLVLKFLPRI